MQRPVLRVQIPNDAKSNTNNSHSGVNNSDGKDTARTVTAVDNSATNQNTQSSNTTSGTGTADTNSSQLNSNGNSNLVPGIFQIPGFRDIHRFDHQTHENQHYRYLCKPNHKRHLQLVL